MGEVTRRARGRPGDPTIPGRLVDASWQLFLRHGVEAVSVESIARLARVSKVTLYRHFPDKEALFEAGVSAEQRRLGELRGSPPEEPDGIEDQLIAFGEATMRYLTAGDAVDFYAVLAGELRRHPALARSFYATGPGHTHAALTALIQQGVDAGSLRADDPAQAAEQLFGMWQGFSNFQLSLGLDLAETRRRALERITPAVRDFLAAHRTP